MVGVKEPLHALVLGVERGKKFLALVRVAQELIDGLLQRVLNAGALEPKAESESALAKIDSCNGF